MVAAKGGFSEIAAILLHYGADINVKNKVWIFITKKMYSSITVSRPEH